MCFHCYSTTKYVGNMNGWKLKEGGFKEWHDCLIHAQQPRKTPTHPLLGWQRFFHNLGFAFPSFDHEIDQFYKFDCVWLKWLIVMIKIQRPNKQQGKNSTVWATRINLRGMQLTVDSWTIQLFSRHHCLASC